MEEAPASVPAPEEIVESSSSKDQTHIVKGKRTKRQRVQSLIPTGLTPITNSSSGDKDYEYEYQDGLLEAEDADMDLVNCLLLLAQGQSRISPHKQDHHHQQHLGGYKFNSRKLMETASNGEGKAGYYVYECKTCNRTFPSFQALGGHRASHKKPNNKSSSIEEKKKQFDSSSDKELDKRYKNISSLSLQLSHNTRNLYKVGGGGGGGGGGGNNNKVHECSVCGAEFASGQALGGHMRRHRSSSVGTINNKALTSTPTTITTKATMELESEQVKRPRKVLSLDLDLNLPPSTPQDDNHNSESKFAFASKQQQQSPNIFFSTPALVDCHY
ncbi:putative C2H2-type zinc finger family protein [Tripterygium wilfordii]|uniref:Putative C2H2-type zinc finger family protein n=1 Tax=Tripterygium wilfordii TaxID=458696 RepID=A0A7J7D8F7_TRIWF|nr:zinc finger protein ZAT5-like [Tripterygium wilfordii]KAF5742594.1 putative C2H2-type zinc finger family protein [Tripterygium wilfordii]